VNLHFGDGCVRFVKNSVNVYTWWALQPYGVGEVLSADAF
jgi:hypothetical protein